MGSGIDGALTFGGTTEYIYGNRLNKALALGADGANRLIVNNLGIAITGDVVASGNYFGNVITALPAGFQLQIAQAVKTDVQTIDTGVSDWVDVTGLGGILTRVSPISGKVRIQASISCTTNDGNNPVAFRIQRDVGQGRVTIGVGTAAGNRIVATTTGGYSGGQSSQPAVIDFIDTPGASSIVGYQIQARVYSPRLGYINRANNDPDVGDYVYRTISTLTLTEIK
jgi:hypothetical protein